MTDRDTTGLSRRQLIARSGKLAGGALVASQLVVPAPNAEAKGADPASEALRALTPEQAGTLEAVLERLLPTDATGPGAKEANVLRYIDWSLAGDLKVFVGPYQSALAAIDAYAQAQFGAVFTALSASQQDTILTEMEANTATGFSPSSQAVFTMIRTHAVQGMFGDPAHGGNVGFVGWKLVGFPGPRLVIDAHDQKLNVKVKNQLQSAYSIKLFKPTKVDR
ncbi:MAG TPA: gluconate 2-dehydrogenase subunit 3 family protein [Solirubrobacteraceae bacterium]|nr:gluconate 2-dehydrogenase subunit 3 family protein [Solirubrobacteraceae bacterium]